MSERQNKAPAFQFYVDDWFSDEKLGVCSLAAQGLWVLMLCLMFKNDRRGYLQISGRPLTEEQLSRLVGFGIDEVRPLLKELVDAEVPSIDEKGIMYSRRMVRDEHLAQVRREAGKQGADNRWNQKQHDFAMAKPMANGVANGIANNQQQPKQTAWQNDPPSSPSSSSSSEEDNTPPLPPQGGEGEVVPLKPEEAIALGKQRYAKAFPGDLLGSSPQWAELFTEFGIMGREFFDKWITPENLLDAAMKSKGWKAKAFIPEKFRKWQSATSQATVKVLQKVGAKVDPAKVQEEQAKVEAARADAAACHKAWNGLSSDEREAILSAGRVNDPKRCLGAIRAEWWQSKKAEGAA